MGLNEDLKTEVDELFDGVYEVTKGEVIPTIQDIGLGNQGRLMEVAMLFIDIHESTTIVNGSRRQTAAKMYKAFLRSVARIVKGNDGELLSFNGDGVLAGFVGGRKCNNAARTALELSWFIEKTLRPKMATYFENNAKLENLDFDYGLGIDVGDVLIVRGGIRGEDNSDLVWVGNATNYSVKLSDLGKWPDNIYISEEVFKRLTDENKFPYNPVQTVSYWEKQTWQDHDNAVIYSSIWLSKPQ